VTVKETITAAGEETKKETRALPEGADISWALYK